jgi:hypothetical protein
VKELLGFWMANEIPKQETDYDGWLDGQSRIFARKVIPFRIREHDAIVRVNPVNEFALIFHNAYRSDEATRRQIFQSERG